MVTAALLALLHAVAPRATDVPEAPPPVVEEAAPAPSPETPPPAAEPLEASTADPFLSSLGQGTGPGLPWQVVLALQLLALMAADALPYLGCVLSSWALSLLVPLGPGLPLAVLMSVLLIPPTALASGCFSAGLLQFLGDRLGTLRGRLACVGCSSVSLSLGTYALVIAPIILGMGFFSVAAATFLSTSVLQAVPQHVLPGPPWLYSVAGYSVSAAGAAVAVAVILLGALTAPVVGFMVRPALVALVYRLTGRSRVAGEEQWPPSMIGERADLWWPFRRREKPAAPPSPAPAAPPVEEPAPPPVEEAPPVTAP